MKHLPLLILIALGVLTFFMISTPPASLPSGAEPVKTGYDLDWIRMGQELDGTLVVRDHAGAELGRYFLLDGLVYQDPGARQGVELELTRSRYLLDPATDLGVWAGYSLGPVNEQDPERFQAGIRYSPIRLGYGVVALDAVASHDLGGLGISVFPPTEYFGPKWRRLGLGAWYCAPWNGGDSGLVVGLSFSSRF